MLDQLIRDFTNNIAEAEEAVAQTVGNLRLLEDDAREAREASASGGARRGRLATAPTSSAPRATPPRPTASTSLAKIALRRQICFEEQVRTFDTQIAQQTELTDKLKDGLNKLRAQARGAGPEARRAGEPGQDGPGPDAGPGDAQEVSVLDPTSELNRFEERIRRQEAQARGMEEVATSSLEDQFAELESGEDELEVEARLAELKGKQLGSGAPAIGSRRDGRPRRPRTGRRAGGAPARVSAPTRRATIQTGSPPRDVHARRRRSPRSGSPTPSPTRRRASRTRRRRTSLYATTRWARIETAVVATSTVSPTWIRARSRSLGRALRRTLPNRSTSTTTPLILPGSPRRPRARASVSDRRVERASRAGRSASRPRPAPRPARTRRARGTRADTVAEVTSRRGRS